MKKLALVISIFLVVVSNSMGMGSSNSSMDIIDTLIQRVESTLSNDWFVVRRNNGFDVFFCRSCYDKYVDSTNKLKNSINGRKNRILILQNSARSIFEQNGPDSIYYYQTVSLAANTDTTLSRKDFASNAIMKISVDIEPKWDISKYNKILDQNNLLRDEIIKDNLGKTNMNIFKDYRFWVPNQNWLLSRIKNFEFSFQQLPYESSWYNYSIFIYQDKPYQFCDALFCNPNDFYYFKNIKNYIDKDRDQALLTIAYSLGIKDYKIYN